MYHVLYVCNIIIIDCALIQFEYFCFVVSLDYLTF